MKVVGGLVQAANIGWTVDLNRPLRERVSEVTVGNTPIDRDRWNTVVRSEEHTSELQSLMRISYAVFCLKIKQYTIIYTNHSWLLAQTTIPTVVLVRRSHT